MKKSDDELLDELRPVEKNRVTLKRQPSSGYKHRHYEFVRSDDAEPTDVLDREADEWLYRLFKPSPSWTRFV